MTSTPDTFIEEKKEFIICAAIKFDDFIQRGNRHADCYLAAATYHGLNSMGEEGFITSMGRFVLRAEAQKIQKSAKIKSHDPNGYNPDGRLFSEDLY